MVVLIYLGVGAIAGFVAGLFGVGGGMVIVPALVVCFAALAVPENIAMQLAVGTSLAAIVVSSLSSVRTHHKMGNIDWLRWRGLAPGIAAGVMLGVATASVLSAESLKLAFGIFCLVIALYMGLAMQPPATRQLPGPAGLLPVGVGIGFFSALFGVGGGSLSVPYLTWCNMRMQKAVATSAACGVPIAVVGAMSNMVAGYGHASLPAYSTGFVYWPALLGLVLLSAPCARWGAQLAQRLSAVYLRRAFAGFLLVVGSQFIWGAL